MSNREVSTLSVAYLRGLADYLSKNQVDLITFLGRFGLDEELLKEPAKRLSAEVYSRMLDHAAFLTGNENIGLHLGEQIKPGQYGALGFAIMSCATLEEALIRHVRYERVVCNMGISSWEVAADEVSLRWATSEFAMHRHVVEDNIAGWVCLGRWLTGSSVSPLQVSFQHDRPLNSDEHDRIFDCRIVFGAPSIEIRFSRQLLKMPLLQSDSEVLSMMEGYLERAAFGIGQVSDFITQVKNLVSHNLPEGMVELERIAERLGYSPRTLQRRLREGGMTYQQLLDNTRKEMALCYIRNPKINLCEITYLLGFTEQSTFQRAFKKWTSMTPHQYRRQNTSVSSNAA